MAGPQVTLSGMKELRKVMGKLEKMGRTGAVDKILFEEARPLEQGMKGRAAGVRRKSGRFARSIARWKDPKLGVRIGARTGKGTPENDRAPHASIVEFGTKAHALGKGGSHPGTPPQPVIRPTWDAGKRAYVRRVINRLNKEVRRAAK